jgi:fluoride exporter
MRWLVVALGGALGAMTRYGVALAVARLWKREFPLATLMINVSGSFVVGFVAGIAAEKASIDPLWRLLIVTGFVGAYTTFSTFELETHQLVKGGSVLPAITYVLASVIAGFVAVQLGIAAGRR